MQYALLIAAPMSAEEELQLHGDGYTRFTQELAAAGKMVGGAVLRRADTAKSVRVRDGQVATTDGPFVEGKEQLTGYYLIDTDDPEDAVAWAARIPAAEYGTVEVRPLLPSN